MRVDIINKSLEVTLKALKVQDKGIECVHVERVTGKKRDVGSTLV
jgi:hypothetical protein